MSDILNEMVFGPHNTTTILVLTLTLVYFGVLVPRPTYKRSQDLVDSKSKTIQMLLDSYKEDLSTIREEIVEMSKHRERLEGALEDLSKKIDDLTLRVGADGDFTDATNEQGTPRGGT